MKSLLSLLASFCLLAGTGLAAEKPNILIIFTDDQGYADLACYGNKKNKTPRLDHFCSERTSL